MPGARSGAARPRTTRHWHARATSPSPRTSAISARHPAHCTCSWPPCARMAATTPSTPSASMTSTRTWRARARPRLSRPSPCPAYTTRNSVTGMRTWRARAAPAIHCPLPWPLGPRFPVSTSLPSLLHTYRFPAMKGERQFYSLARPARFAADHEDGMPARESSSTPAHSHLPPAANPPAAQPAAPSARPVQTYAQLHPPPA